MRQLVQMILYTETACTYVIFTAVYLQRGDGFHAWKNNTCAKKNKKLHGFNKTKCFSPLPALLSHCLDYMCRRGN